MDLCLSLLLRNSKNTWLVVKFSTSCLFGTTYFWASIFHEMSQFKHMICFQCSILNEVWVYDICKSVESFFLNLHFTQCSNFFWKWVCKKQKYNNRTNSKRLWQIKHAKQLRVKDFTQHVHATLHCCTQWKTFQHVYTKVGIWTNSVKYEVTKDFRNATTWDKQL